jgi:single-strand DNA-binding protein
MANDLNQCNFIGRLGRDPEMRTFPSGDEIATFSLAVGQTWKDKATGERKERTGST